MVVGARIHGGAIDQQVKRGGEMLPCALGAFVFLSDTTVDASETCADAVLVPCEGVQVDGVGEVGCEQLVTLVLESLAIVGQLGQFLRAGGEAFVERGLDLFCLSGVPRFRDGDVCVAISDQLINADARVEPQRAGLLALRQLRAASDVADHDRALLDAHRASSCPLPCPHSCGRCGRQVLVRDLSGPKSHAMQSVAVSATLVRLTLAPGSKAQPKPCAGHGGSEPPAGRLPRPAVG